MFRPLVKHFQFQRVVKASHHYLHTYTNVIHANPIILSASTASGLIKVKIQFNHSRGLHGSPPRFSDVSKPTIEYKVFEKFLRL
jgi:hypothetical protein